VSADGERPYGYAFWALCLANLLCFCNLAIFYGFYTYLEGLGIPAAWRGPLLALEPLIALALRPWLGVILTLRNSLRAMRLGVVLAIAALASYPFAHSIPTIAAVRVLHGAGYVILASALITAFINFLPEGKVAQGFGLLSLTTILPGAFMPPFVEAVTPFLPAPGYAYAMAAPLMLVVLVLLIPLGARARALAAALPPEHCRKPSLAELRANLRTPGVAPLWTGYLLALAAQTIVYFFVKAWGLSLGAANPGLFLTCANGATMAVRVLGMQRYDAFNPGRVVALALLAMALLTPCFGLAGSAAILDLMALPYGAALGLGLPLFNAAMYRVSPPHLRSLNANLLLVAVDAGFILGPLVGGQALAAGLPLAGLFALCGGLFACACFLVLPVGRLTPAQPGKA